MPEKDMDTASEQIRNEPPKLRLKPGSRPMRETSPGAKPVARPLAAGIVLFVLWQIGAFHEIAEFLGHYVVPQPKWALPADTALAAGGDPVAGIPEGELAFIKVVKNYAGKYATSSNDMARGALRPKRATEICALKMLDPVDWVGRIETLSSNNSGKGVLGIRISEHIIVSTFNNEISDGLSGVHTLIDTNSRLHEDAVSSSVGDTVSFTGKFIRDTDDCIKEISLTVDSAMVAPTFLIHFSSLHTPH